MNFICKMTTDKLPFLFLFICTQPKLLYVEGRTEFLVRPMNFILSQCFLEPLGATPKTSQRSAIKIISHGMLKNDAVLKAHQTIMRNGNGSKCINFKLIQVMLALIATGTQLLNEAVIQWNIVIFMLLHQLSFALHTCKSCKCKAWLQNYFLTTIITVNSH